jgi:hypothetical protein
LAGAALVAALLMTGAAAGLGEGVAAAAGTGDHASEMKAREAFAAGRYDEALELFAKLYAETLHPVYLRNIGRCHQKMREPQKAIDAFQDYITKSKKLAPDERQEIDGYIKEMEALRDEQARAAAATNATTAPPPPITTPVLTASAPPPPEATSGALVLTSSPGSGGAPERTPVYKRWWFWTALVVVAAGGTAAALVLAKGGTIRPDCPSTVESCK